MLRQAGRAGSVVLVALALAGAAIQGKKYSATVSGIWIPDGVSVLRGIIVDGGYGPFTDPDGTSGEFGSFGESAYGMRFACMGLKLPLGDHPTKEQLASELKIMADKSGHPELVNLPFCGAGHSAGNVGLWFAETVPERTIALGISGLGVDSYPGIPCVTARGQRDGADVQNLVPDLYGRRAAHGLTALAPMWAMGHQYSFANALFMPYFEQLAALRLPADWDPKKGMPQLKTVKEEDGWLCETPDSTDLWTEWLTIAPYKDYPKDKSKASWMPNAYTAWVYRAFVSHVPGQDKLTNYAGNVRIAQPGNWAQIEVGYGGLPPRFDLGQAFTITPSFTSTAGLTKVEYYDGDLLLGEGAGFLKILSKVSLNTPGTRSLIAVATYDNGVKTSSRPVTIYVNPTGVTALAPPARGMPAAPRLSTGFAGTPVWTRRGGDGTAEWFSAEGKRR